MARKISFRRRVVFLRHIQVKLATIIEIKMSLESQTTVYSFLFTLKNMIIYFDGHNW